MLGWEFLVFAKCHIWNTLTHIHHSFKQTGSGALGYKSNTSVIDTSISPELLLETVQFLVHGSKFLTSEFWAINLIIMITEGEGHLDQTCDPPPRQTKRPTTHFIPTQKITRNQCMYSRTKEWIEKVFRIPGNIYINFGTLDTCQPISHLQLQH